MVDIDGANEVVERLVGVEADRFTFGAKGSIFGSPNGSGLEKGSELGPEKGSSGFLSDLREANGEDDAKGTDDRLEGARGVESQRSSKDP